VVEGTNYFGQKFANENTCQVCQGSGKQVTKVCPICGGKKIITQIEKVKITIPKGLPDGNVLKVRNFWDETVNGAPADV
jgi:molecular chaperone DnaJ